MSGNKLRFSAILGLDYTGCANKQTITAAAAMIHHWMRTL